MTNELRAAAERLVARWRMTPPLEWCSEECEEMIAAVAAALAAEQPNVVDRLRAKGYATPPGGMIDPSICAASDQPAPAEQSQPVGWVVLDGASVEPDFYETQRGAEQAADYWRAHPQNRRGPFSTAPVYLAPPPPAAAPRDAQAEFCAALMDRPAVYCGRAQEADDELYEASFTFDTAEKVERVWKAYERLVDAPPAAAPITQDAILDEFCRTPGLRQHVQAFEAGVRFAERALAAAAKERG